MHRKTFAKRPDGRGTATLAVDALIVKTVTLFHIVDAALHNRRYHTALASWKPRNRRGFGQGCTKKRNCLLSVCMTAQTVPESQPIRHSLRTKSQ